MKVIIDVDTGIDDSLALLYAVKKPEIEIVGITTVCGNVDAYQAADNACRILDLAGASRDIPVVIGANAPLEGRWDGTVAHIHGENGLGNAVLPASPRKPLQEPVEDFLNRMGKRYKGELTLITLGRLTNIALTLKKHPEFAANINKVVMMGGTLHYHGNVTPVAEANVAGDPAACDMVFTSGMDVTVVGLDVTMKTRLNRGHIDMLRHFCRDEDRGAAEYLGMALDYYFRGNRLQDGCLDDCPVHDPLAVIVAAVPGIVTLRSLKARVECHGDFCRGMVVTDLRRRPFEAKDVRFAVEVDATAAVEELLSVFW